MSRRKLHLAQNLTLPPDFITMATVVYGARGSGKTTLGAVVAEEVRKIGQRFVAIDLKGDFYGLRSSADGEREGIPVVIFGGERADVPLEEGAGAYVGKLVAELEQSVVLDFERMSKGKQLRFLGEFYAALYHENREPLLVIIDEAQRSAPQKPISPDASVCLGAVEDLVKLGRKHGIGVMLLTQRGAGLNKEVSEICDALVAFRTPGSIDQDRIEGWLRANGFVDEARACMSEIPRLKTGEAIFASAHPDISLFVRARVRRRETFDSSATPRVGQERREPRRLAEPELDAIRERMSAAIERAKASDPRELQKEVAKLRTLVAKQAGAAEIEELRAQLAEALARPTEEVVVIEQKDVDRLVKAIEQFSKVLDRHMAETQPHIGRVGDAMRALSDKLAAVQDQERRLRPRQSVKTAPPPQPIRAPARAARPPVEIPAEVGGQQLTSAQQRILDAVAWFAAVGVNQPQRAAVAAVAGMAQSGHFNNSLGGLHTSGLVTYPAGKRVSISHDGEAVARRPAAPPTLADYHAMVAAKVSRIQAKMLEALIRAYPADASRPDLAAEIEASESGHFNNSLGALHTAEFVEYPSRGRVRAASALFPAGLA